MILPDYHTVAVAAASKWAGFLRAQAKINRFVDSLARAAIQRLNCRVDRMAEHLKQPELYLRVGSL
jgi:hypothetical protein